MAISLVLVSSYPLAVVDMSCVRASLVHASRSEDFWRGPHNVSREDLAKIDRQRCLELAEVRADRDRVAARLAIAEACSLCF